jgi:hypothetical protein
MGFKRVSECCDRVWDSESVLEMSRRAICVRDCCGCFKCADYLWNTRFALEEIC